MPCSSTIEKFIHELDKDGSGKISAEELLKGLNCDGIKLEEVKEFIKTIDKDGDGQLDKKELMDFFAELGL